MQWTDIDEAFLQVATAVREAAARISNKRSQPASHSAPKVLSADSHLQNQIAGPRSSNLRLAKTFTQRDKDQFQLETFEFIARYFENSLAELEVRNPGFQGVFRRVDANRFFATIYRNGDDVARATIYTGGDDGFGKGINYVHGETTRSNSMNESLTVQADDQTLYFTSLGMASYGNDRGQKLSETGAAELFWSIFIRPLQG